MSMRRLTALVSSVVLAMGSGFSVGQDTAPDVQFTLDVNASELPKAWSTKGDVKQSNGTLILAPGASLKQPTSIGLTMQWQVDISPAPPAGDVADSAVRLDVEFDNGAQMGLILVYAHVDDKKLRQMAVVARHPPKFGLLPSKEGNLRVNDAVTEGTHGGVWQLRFRQGFLECFHDGAETPEIVGYYPTTQSTQTVRGVAGLRIEAVGRPVSIRKWDVQGSAPAPAITKEAQRKVAEANQLNQEFMAAYAKGKFKEAIRKQQQAIEILEDTLGRNTPLLARSQNNLAAVYFNLGDFERAERLMQTLVENHRQSLGADHPEVISSQANLGALYVKTDRVQEGLELMAKVVEGTARIYGMNDEQLIVPLTSIAQAHSRLGQVQLAEMAFSKAVHLTQREHGQGSPELIGPLNGLGLVLIERGDYRTARKHLERALRLARSHSSRIQPSTLAESLNNLALLLHYQRDLRAARPLYEESLEIMAKQFGPRHHEYGPIHNNLGNVLLELDERDAARKHLITGLTQMQETFGRQSLEAANQLHSLAAFHDFAGENAKAIEKYREALEIRERRLGNDHWQTSVTRIGLAGVVGDDDPMSAREHLNQALNGLRSTVGERHPLTSTALKNLASHWLTEDAVRAVELYQQALEVDLQLARELAPTLSEAEALAYVEQCNTARRLLLTAIGHLDQVSADDIYQRILPTRGLTSRLLTYRQLFSRQDPATGKLKQRLASVRRKLSQVMLQPASKGDLESRNERLLEITKEKEALERQLAHASQEFVANAKWEGANLEQIQASLGAGVALVDFVESRSGIEAFVIIGGEKRNGGGSVTWVSLDDRAKLEQRIRSWRERLQQSAVELASGSSATLVAFQRDGKRLREQIWAPLEPALKGVKQVYLVPEGLLARLPWAALPGKANGSYLIEDYAVGCLSFPQLAISSPPARTQRPIGLLAVGGVDYNQAAARQSGNPSSNDESPRSKPKSGKWEYLPATLKEIDLVSALQPQDKVRRLSQADATEQRLKELVAESKVVHLATHGFFLPSPGELSDTAQSARAQSLSPQALGLNGLGAHSRNPLTQVGVVLSGANLPQDSDASVGDLASDGVLTAEEVLSLDLDGVDLVVLSACETALGEVSGDGVMGLQRALLMAGAKCTVGSLWMVEDRATQHLMVEFYRNLWKAGLPPLEAMRQSQLKMLNDYDAAGAKLRGIGGVRPAKGSTPAARSGQRCHPFFWAAFGVSGR